MDLLFGMNEAHVGLVGVPAAGTNENLGSYYCYWEDLIPEIYGISSFYMSALTAKVKD